VNGAWKGARRTIVVDANVLLDRNLGVFLQAAEVTVAPRPQF
jgi:hypothetical protein